MNEQKKTSTAEGGETRLAKGELLYYAARGLLDDAARTQDADKAVLGSELLLQAAEMDVTPARLFAGQVYSRGWFGIAPDREKGIALLREAVADGDSDAEVELALALYMPPCPTDAKILWEGATVLWRERMDFVAAHRLMSRAARLGYVPAMRDYAQMIREGVGCEKDPKLAAEVDWQADELARE